MQMDERKPERTPKPRRKQVPRWLDLWAVDILLTAGVTLVSVGAAMIYPPAGVIAVGVFLIIGGVLLARGGGGP